MVLNFQGQFLSLQSACSPSARARQAWMSQDNGPGHTSSTSVCILFCLLCFSSFLFFFFSLCLSDAAKPFESLKIFLPKYLMITFENLSGVRRHFHWITDVAVCHTSQISRALGLIPCVCEPFQSVLLKNNDNNLNVILSVVWMPCIMSIHSFKDDISVWYQEHHPKQIIMRLFPVELIHNQRFIHFEIKRSLPWTSLPGSHV